MAGRIRDEDIVTVRERSPIAQIVGDHVQLKSAGTDRLKGLCPFHDEKSPSFYVTMSLNYFHCFGCGESGDVISFVQKIDHLTFPEAVERLAARAGIELTYEQGGAAPRQQSGQRRRLIEAHVAAAEFFATQLAESPEATVARDFLAARGFDRAAAEDFGCGYSPMSWDALIKHLTGRKFTREELLASGLASEGRRGPIDRFRGRLMWPIRDVTGDVIGFGARKLHDDDQGPKYLNTPETPIYKKSHVLYGLDRAKKEIARRHQAVVVEGYTDVMACHLAGVPTAVATCGTAFGPDHIAVLRQRLLDQDEFRSEVIFTFDGDEAGQKAALRAFNDDQKFVTQTYIAVSPDGLDPCDLRLQRGDAAVRDLVARRTPLFEFAIKAMLRRHNLETAEGRVAALTAAAPLVAQIRDVALRPEYARQLAGWLGMDVEPVVARVAELSGGRQAPQQRRQQARPRGADDAARSIEREALKLAVQRPALVGPAFDAVPASAFTDPAYAEVRTLIEKAGGAAMSAGGGTWVTSLVELASDDAARQLVTELAVEPPRTADEPDARYADVVLSRVLELALTREITELKGRLQRVNPVEAATEYNALFGDLVGLEQHRRQLREKGIGAL